MRMNSGIILAGQQPDFVNVLRQSNAAAGEANQVRTQNALRELYQTQGPQIAAGEQGAMNALSRFDPKAALGIQGDRQGLEAGALNMDATRLGMSATQQRMDILSSEEKRAVQESAARLSAVERAAAAEKVQQGLMTGIQLHQAGDLPGLNALLQSVGEQPIQSLDQFPGVAVKYKGVLDALSSVEEFKQGPEDPASIQALRIRAREAGMRPGTPEYAEFMAKGGKPDKGMQIVSDGKGGFTFTQGDGVGGKDKTDVSNPSSPAAMVSTIDGILNDPALDTATGVLSFMQNVPGTGQKRFGTRANQLEGQAFLQAFESLKGAGQITEIEGAKATQAIGRLDTAQSPDDYRQALTELKDVLNLAQGRPVGWAEQQSSAPGEIPSISDEAGYNALPSGTVFTAPDGTQRRKP